MPFDESLAARVRLLLADEAGYSEKKMFGGICFLLNGNMCCGVARHDLMLRVGAAQQDAALTMKHARPMDFTGRPMTGMIFVEPDGVATEKELRTFVAMATAFTSPLPPKKAKRS